MGQIRLKQYYTELVEHFFRMAVRYNKIRGTPEVRAWFDFTHMWIDLQSKEDKEFIRFVFGYRYRTTSEGLYAFQSNNSFKIKRKRLAALEREYAIAGDLVCFENTGETTPMLVKEVAQNEQTI